MIHLVTCANRALYARQIEEMHRLRWKYCIEERGWRELRELQREEGVERDAYDDERALYIMGLDGAGDLTGSARLRPIDDGSLLLDRFPHLVDDSRRFEPSARIWEITRMLRKPENRGSENRSPENRSRDHALRFAMNTAMVEAALTRGVRKLVGCGDSFWTPAARKLWRHKFRPLGLPAAYPEGEMIGLEFDADEEALCLLRDAGGFIAPLLFEMPPPAAGRRRDPVLEAQLVRLLRILPAARTAELIRELDELNDHEEEGAA